MKQTHTSKKNSMTFYTYMMHNHLHDDSPVGDLAVDMKDDHKKFPKYSKVGCDYNVILNHLYDCRACEECISAFEEAWKMYTAEVHR